jgi:mucin-22
MKAALVSATSLAALLAFEVGLDVAIDARPASAQSFTSSPSVLNFGNVLLNTTFGTTVLPESVVIDTSSKVTLTIPAVATSPFSGSNLNTVLTGKSGTTLAPNYTYTPTTIGTNSTSLTITGTITSGSQRGSTTAALTLTGQAVAPRQSSTPGTTSFGAVRIGTTATIAAITVANTLGNGDLYSSTLSAAQLQVSLGTPSNSVFTGPATSTFSLNDTHYTGTGTATTTAAITYSFAPTAHATNQTGTAAVNFLNGGSNTNGTTASIVALTGTGVGPVFESSFKGTTFSNGTAIGNTVVNAGNLALGTQKHGTTVTATITLSNVTTDAASTLTNLTLESFKLGACAVSTVANGCSSDGFSVLSFAAGTIAENGVVDVTLDFSGGLATYYDADLSFNTDQGAAGGVGGAGAVFTYLLTANIPEPATIVTFGMGLAGLGWARRRRNARRSAVGTTTSIA